jgi:hypothetical protein
LAARDDDLRHAAQLPAPVVAVGPRRRLAHDAAPDALLRQPEARRQDAVVLVYADAPLTHDASPLLQVTDERGVGSPTIRIVAKGATLPARQWIRIRLPFSTFTGLFNGTSDVEFDPARLASIAFIQAWTTCPAHAAHRRDPDRRRRRRDGRSGAFRTAGLAARGYDRHVDLTWQPSASPELLHYRIHRSVDGGPFVPVGIQKRTLTRYADFVGAGGRQVAYRISAVDTGYRESPPSAPVSAATRSLSDDELLTMVQEATFRYYWDAADPDAGMAIEIRPGDERLIAVGSSGFGVMAIVAGVDRRFVTPRTGRGATPADRAVPRQGGPLPRRLAALSGRPHRPRPRLLRPVRRRRRSGRDGVPRPGPPGGPPVLRSRHRDGARNT